MFLQSLKYHIFNCYCIVLKTIAGLIPKDKKLVVFSAWLGEKYADNTMYLFEYMLINSDYDVYWYTTNKALYNNLKQQNIPVVYSKTIKAIWYQMRAKILLSTIQTSDFNSVLLNKCILLDLDHGFPGKPVCLAQPDADERWKHRYFLYLKGVDFYQTASSKFVVESLAPCYGIPTNHFVFANKPRIDVLFDKELQKGKNSVVDKIKQSHKIISYLPTHRACGSNPIPVSEIFDLDKIQEICEKRNAYFIIKKHFYHRGEIEKLEKYNNIIDLTGEVLDTQVLLAQSDVLVTDFSSCYIDYLTLNRPIIFYAYDYERFITQERDFYWKYDKIEAGYAATTKEDFTKALESVASDWVDGAHITGRQNLRLLYFDKNVEMGTSREKHKYIIDSLANNTYKPFNWGIDSK